MNIPKDGASDIEVLEVETTYSKRSLLRPVRKIQKSHRSLVGSSYQYRSHLRSAFESRLEYDLHTLLRFDINIERIIEQPMKIRFRQADQLERHYVPDLLVVYRTDYNPANEMLPMLVEVKYDGDLRQNLDKLQPKFQAAQLACRLLGCRFKVLTEHDIRVPRLKNARFLLQYAGLKPDGEMIRDLINSISNQVVSTPRQLLESVANSQYDYLRLIPQLWYLIYSREIGINFDVPINMESEIWYLSLFG